MREVDKRILEAASAQDIEAANAPPWFIKKLPVVGPEPLILEPDERLNLGKRIFLPPGVYTSLFRLTEVATSSKGFGELVMHDFPDELNKHLDFMRRAHGRVLITGLGLGCVARGCAANPNVDSVTVIEKDPCVLKLVAPYMPIRGSNLPPELGGPKINIIYADAVEWCEQTTIKFDCAWHDLWTDEAAGEPHLQVVHGRLIKSMTGKVESFQGAWELPRWFKRLTNCI